MLWRTQQTCWLPQMLCKEPPKYNFSVIKIFFHFALAADREILIIHPARVHGNPAVSSGNDGGGVWLHLYDDDRSHLSDMVRHAELCVLCTFGIFPKFLPAALDGQLLGCFHCCAVGRLVPCGGCNARLAGQRGRPALRSKGTVLMKHQSVAIPHIFQLKETSLWLEWHVKDYHNNAVCMQRIRAPSY